GGVPDRPAAGRERPLPFLDVRTPMIANRRLRSTIVVLAMSVVAALASPATGALSAVSVAMTTKTADKPAQVRVNQVGYATNGAKVAYVMLPKKVASVRFEVVTPFGVAYRGVSADDVGGWNANYQAVYKLSCSGLTMPGRCRVRLLSPAGAVSPGFTVGDGTQLHGRLVDNAVRYFTSERDGPDVVSSVLSRQPAN